MNKETFNYILKTNTTFISSFAGLFICMIISLAWLFPTLSADASYTQLLQGIPESLRNALGVVGNQNSYFGFISANYFNSLHLYFMMAFVIMLGQQLVSKPIDDTSLSYFLSGSLSRSTYLTTLCVFIELSTFCVSLSAWISTWVGNLIFAPDSPIPWSDITILNNMVFLVFALFAALVVLVRVASKDGKTALTVSTTIILTEYCLSMASALSPKLKWLGDLTLFSLLNTSQWNTNMGGFWLATISLIIGTLLLIVASVQLFKKKDLFL